MTIKSPGQPYQKPQREIVLKGPYSDSYERTEEFSLKNKPWLSCLRKKTKLKIQTKIEILPFPKKKNSQYGFMSVDQAEGIVKEKVGLIWTECDPKKRIKPFFSFCRLKVYNTKKNRLVRVRIAHSRAEKEKQSLEQALEKAKRICEKNF